MIRYQTGVLERFRYSATRGCGTAEVCPAFSLPDLFTTPASRRDAGAIRALLDAVPPYFSQSVVSADRRTATLAFGIRLMDLERQADVIEEMRARLADGRPAGVRAQLAGLPVLAADANAEVASNVRRMLTLLAGLLAVALVLLVALRSVDRALVPLVPIALATGWSALVLFALRVPLNPMSVTLGALVIAISTEFSVLLSERYRSERAQGHDPRTALERTYRSTGAAVLASGATAIAGFAVLVVSDIRMLRDFGFVTVDRPDRLAARRDARAARRAAARRAPRRSAARRGRMTGRDGPLGFEPERRRRRRRRRRPRRARPPPAAAPVAGHRYAWLLGIAAILAVAAAHDPLRAARRAPRDRRAGRRAAAGVRGRARDVRRRLRRRGRPLRRQRRRLRRPRPRQQRGQPPGLRGARSDGPQRLRADRARPARAQPDRLARRELPRLPPIGSRRSRAAIAGCRSALVAIGGGLEELRRSVRRRGWSFPVGWDRDGILAGVYGVAACPYVTVARWRGRVQGTLVGAPAASGGELERLVDAAVAASRRAGWRP